MSTKNLARSIIEGGRVGRNKWERHNSHAEQRAQVRNYLKEVTLDPENYEEYDVEPTQHVRKEFDDKLGPIYRWLHRQVGRPWDEVRADVANEFDTRTTAGRHIVYDHMLNSVQVGPEPQYRYSSTPEDPTTSYSKNAFYVDDEGILCKKRYLGRRRYHGDAPRFDTKQIANWLSGRIVGRVGDKFFWFVPVGKGKKHRGVNHEWRTVWGGRHRYYYDHGLHFEYLSEKIIYKKDSLGRPVIEDGKQIEVGREPVWQTGYKPHLRQDRKLNDKEMEFWNSLPAFYQTKILEQSPNYPNPPKQDYYSGYYY